MIAYTLKQDDDGQWSICCMGSIFASGLSLEPAIKLAHEMAHTTRMDSARPTCVEVIQAGIGAPAAGGAQPESRWRSAAA